MEKLLSNKPVAIAAFAAAFVVTLVVLAPCFAIGRAVKGDRGNR